MIFLISEIKFKKRELSRLYRFSHRLKADLVANIDYVVYVRTASVIESLNKQREKGWAEIHDTKLKKLRLQQHHLTPSDTAFEYPKRAVQNFSKRILTDEESDALSSGLDFVFATTKLDDETVIANIETFFVSLLGYATERKDYETKDEDERTHYKLTTEQLRFANKIRRLTDEYRSKTSIILKKNGLLGGKSLSLLRNLGKDNSIIITKAGQRTSGGSIGSR